MSARMRKIGPNAILIRSDRSLNRFTASSPQRAELHLLLVEARANDVIAGFLDEGGFLLDLLVEGIDPTIIDPAAALGIRGVHDIFIVELAIGVFRFERGMADHARI